LGAGRIARRVEALEPTASNVFVAAPWSRLFREMNSFRAPLLATTATALAFALTALVQDGWKAALVRGGTWFVLGIPIWSFLWSYASLQLGLSRLGRAHLRQDVSFVDPSLVLRPFGAVAFTGLWLLLVAMVPVVVTGLPDVTGLVIGLLVLGFALAGFVFSLWGLHRQIVEVKENHLALARDLYAEAYEPVRAERTLEALERQHSLLGAADALEKRARAIHDWPVAEGTWAWVIGIATSVVAIACARLILRPLGF
jgi:cell division protein FtsB